MARVVSGDVRVRHLMDMSKCNQVECLGGGGMWSKFVMSPVIRRLTICDLLPQNERKVASLHTEI